MHSQDCDKSLFSVFHFEKASLSLGFFRCLPFSFVCVRRNHSRNLAFKSTGAEDTYLTLAVISFQVGVNNSLNFLFLQTFEKRFAEFPSL